MSSRELIEALRKSGEDKVRALMLQAEQQAAHLGDETERRLQELRAGYAAKIADMTEQAERNAAVNVSIETRRIKLAAEQKAAERLYASARKLLPRLRDASYDAVFAKLAAELPPGAWTSIRVNPADVSLAQSLFHDATIIPAEEIIGGLDAGTEDGAIHIVNTFDKRLERAWDDLLPDLMKDLEREATHGASQPT